MKQKYICFLGSCIALIAFIVFFAIGHNQYDAPAPEPSAPGGFYAEPFSLTFSFPENGVVYYTTDGSTPTPASSVYTGGIWIHDRSQEPNIYNAVQNVVTDWKNYTPDPTPVPKGTVIRAIFVNQKGISSDICTQTYFVGIQPPERGYALSLIFEKDALFGSDGIYVTGEAYDQWYLSGGDADAAPTPNFEKKLEVPAQAELLGPDGDILNQPIGLRLQGASTRGVQKKRFTLSARTELSGKTVWDTALFDGISTHSVMVKGNLPDAIANQLFSDRSVSTQRSVPVRVYLNGEYLYDSYLLERYDKQYFRQHYGVDDRVLVKNGITDAVSADSGVDYYGEFMDWVARTDFSDSLAWEQLQQEMDLQSYIDYIAINYYLCNWDVSENKNYLLWRSPSAGAGPYTDGRWRWCIYDIDIIEYAKYNSDVTDPALVNIFTTNFSETRLPINRSVLFTALRRNSEFDRRFVTSFMDIVNNTFAPRNVAAVLSQHGQTLDWMDGFFRKRPEYAAQHLAQEFGLTGSLETVTIETAQPEMGTVQVNTSVIDLSSGTWSGKYFTDYPITVTATPKDGCTFIGWKGASGETAPTIELSMENGPVLEAVFAKVK